jgi:hypothetical protein
MQEWTPTNVHDVDDDAIVELNVVPQGKAEATWGLTVLLTEVAILGKVLKGLLVGIMAGLAEQLQESFY